ncbi:nudC domain-containing protein 1 [Bombyx mandarina]|uniref:NudC domain-containing protein 1 n=2 Tax=Bombyx TaxID=7090 RepID=A0A8R2AMK7_BOMMO|nr:nudC domain-containing protein 1 [Bombyx mori]XP_028029689.1 nudC domain-containing protein 1 [Bombyx mandarina]
MSSSLVELRPNRRLLELDFEGYKLNLQALPHYSLELASPVDKVYPDDVQYSFVHAKLFALHNHLVLDYWDYSFNYYYIDKNQQVRHVTFENINHTFQNNIVYDIPAHIERKPGHFNPSLTFPASNLAVVSDGTGMLHIVDTGPRNRSAGRNQLWHTLQSSLILGENKYFVIVDARIQEKKNTETLHCLLQSVQQNEKHFESVLTWVSFDNDGESWKQMSFRQVQGKGIVHYAAIETSCSALYVASDNIFKFTMDSETEITQKNQRMESRKIIYTWLQTSEDVTVTLKLEEKYNKKHFHVLVSPITIKVSYAGKTFVEGKLKHNVDSNLTTWNVQEDGKVDILITKSDSMLWDELIEGGDPNGEQIVDANLVEEAHQRLAHLCSETEATSEQSVPGFSTQELEECDAASEEDTVLVRLDATNHEITHRIPLSVHQYLFSVRLETQEVPALALRQDVDACIWQPYSLLVNTETWPVTHQGTLSAFGYVQSSKQNRKFVTCPPNFSYSVVCESERHIFIYRSTGNQDSQLRKRTGGMMKAIKVGQQNLFNIDKYGEVLGINATNEYLFILTEKTLVAIEVQ